MAKYVISSLHWELVILVSMQVHDYISFNINRELVQ